MDAELADDQGFITGDEVVLEAEEFALVTAPADIETPPPASWPAGSPAAVKIEARHLEGDRGVFLGVAETSELERYLSGVAYAELVDFSVDPFGVDYVIHPGTSPAEPPGDQDFWAAAARGVGPQTLRWEIEPGSYSLVFMNEDGTSGVAMSASVGVRVPAIGQAGRGLLSAGVAAAVGGAILVILALE
ncbi:MAG: hypothetical protein ACP5G2_00120 [Candidatus Bipolaricaulaceae bacterium]